MFNLFGGDECYYASGGANDFIKSFNTLEEAISFIKTSKLKVVYDYDDEPLDYELAWWHVTNANMKIVEASKGTPHRADVGFAHKK